MRKLLKVLSSKNRDPSSEAGRNWERDRLHAFAVVSNLASRASVLALLILSSRLALPDLGNERFGVWMTVASFLNLIAFLDLGLGNAIVTPIATADGQGNKARVQELISQGVFLSLIMGGMALLLLIPIALWFPLSTLFKGLALENQAEARQALVMFAVMASAWIPMQLMQRVLAGLRRAYIGHVSTIAASLLSGLILLTIHNPQMGVLSYVGLTFGSTLLAGVPALFVLLKNRQIKKLKAEQLSMARLSPLLKSGGLYLVLQLGVLFAWGMDQALISSLVGAAAVAPYAIVVRIFMLISQPLFVLNSPLWSSYAHAIASGDKAYLRRRFKTSVLFTATASLVGVLAMLLLGRSVWTLFTGSSIPYPSTLMIAFAIWTVIESTCNALSMLLNGAHVIKEQLVTTLLLVSIAIPSKFYFISTFGSVAAPLVTTGAFLLSVAFLYGVVFRHRIASILN